MKDQLGSLRDASMSDDNLSGFALHKTLLIEAADRQNIEVSLVSNDFLFVLMKNNKRRLVWGWKFGLNSASSAMVADDKYATYSLLESSGVPSVECELIYAPKTFNEWSGMRNKDAFILDYFRRHNEHIVVKPNHGSQGAGVAQVQNESELKKALRVAFSLDRSASLCPFYDLESEFRAVILDGEVRLFYQKVPKNDWRFNLHNGAHAEIRNPEKFPDVIGLALRATKALGLRFCSADVVITKDHKLFVMEVNSGVMMTGYLAQHPEARNVVLKIYEDALIRMFEG